MIWLNSVCITTATPENMSIPFGVVTALTRTAPRDARIRVVRVAIG